VEELQKLPGYQADLLEEVTIGYELTENKQKSQIVSLQPIWCYKYNGKWKKIEINGSDKLGGDKDGLE
jgi:regulatory protein YycH of two-component signal transduction system YycFG